MTSATRVLLFALLMLAGCRSGAEPLWIGANVKVSPSAPWGSEQAQASLRQLAHTGATHALLVAFVWQAAPASNDPVLGSDSSVEQMRQAVRQAKAAGLRPVLKLHVWVPGHWAGEVAPADAARWFEAYRNAILPLVRMAAQERVPALVLGTELRQLQDAPQWPQLVAAVRKVYQGQLIYVADGLEHAASFRYWNLFDVVGVSLYPKLPDEPGARRVAMQDVAGQLRSLGQQAHRPVWVAELGLRSAVGSLAAPWESPEQRQAPVDTAIQTQVLLQWRDALRAGGIDAIGIWCWYTDPNVGGPDDTDFTVQNKPARAVFAPEGSKQRQ